MLQNKKKRGGNGRGKDIYVFVCTKAYKEGTGKEETREASRFIKYFVEIDRDERQKKWGGGGGGVVEDLQGRRQ